jgi:hypothetical protein
MRYWRRRDDWRIVNLLDDGKSPKQVATELGISIWAVYRANTRWEFRENVSRVAVQKIAKRIL